MKQVFKIKVHLIAPVICCMILVSSIIYAQTQINYNRQIQNKPIQHNLESAQALPDGPINYYGDPSKVTMISIPQNVQLGPGNCIRPSFAGDPPVPNIPVEYQSTAAPALYFTPTAVYACTPDGTGHGFHLIKLTGVSNW